MLLSRRQNAGQNHDIKKANRYYEHVPQSRYLRTTLTNQSSILGDISRSPDSSNACYHSVQNLLLSKSLQIGMFKAIILPVILDWDLQELESFVCAGRQAANNIQLSHGYRCIIAVTGKCATLSVSWKVVQARTCTAWTSASCTPRSAQRRGVVATELPHAAAMKRGVILLKQNAWNMLSLRNKQFHFFCKHSDHPKIS
jgi:hypothetical protein